MVREFAGGFRTLLRGFGAWRTHTGLMLLGLLPALLSALILLAALIPLALSLSTIAAALTPFADGWEPIGQSILRVGVWIVIFVAALVLAGSLFSALALTIGDPFYQRIVRGVEKSLSGEDANGGLPFGETLRDGVRLAMRGGGVSALALAVGVIPVVGSAAAFSVGAALSGRLLARELLGRAFGALSMPTVEQSRLIDANKARVTGFGAVTYLFFLIPFGALVTMPAAVAGATMLAHELRLRDEATAITTDLTDA